MTTAVNWVPRRDLSEESFLDITTSAVSLSWEQDGSATALFEADLTEPQIIDVMLRMGTTDENDAVRMVAMLQARIDNETYLNAGFIDADAVQAQMTVITNQNTAIATLLLGPLAFLTIPQ